MSEQAWWFSALVLRFVSQFISDFLSSAAIAFRTFLAQVFVLDVGAERTKSSKGIQHVKSVDIDVLRWIHRIIYWKKYRIDDVEIILKIIFSSRSLLDANDVK